MNYRHLPPAALAGIAAMLGLALGFVLWHRAAPTHAAAAAPTDAQVTDPKGTTTAPATVTLTESQSKALSTAPIDTRTFTDRRTAFGSLEFDENAMVSVFPNYPGKITRVWVDIGDAVRQGQALYAIDSPDLLQAENTLIAAAGAYQVTTAALERAKTLHDADGFAQKDLDQAEADQHSADIALQAARATLLQFGQTAHDIDQIVTSRQLQPELVVRSPVAGRVTARMAQPGLYVQPGALPAPITVANVTAIWLLANVAESDSLSLRVGQPITAQLSAYPDRTFPGTIAVVGEMIDPATHTLPIRAVIADPTHSLRAGLLASFSIAAGKPVSSLAIPVDGVVREGDGTMSAWVTRDHLHYEHRTVTLGHQQDGFRQVLDGLQPGDTVVTKGALLLSNILYGHADE